MEDKDYILHRRFDRMARLVGESQMETLFKSHVMIIGIGGVGSFVAESIARSGIGKITLVDFDDICITNSNRQLHALVGQVGKKKSAVMAERLRLINPQADVQSIEVFYNAASFEEVLSHQPDLIIECIDNLTAKSHLIATCKERNIPIFVAGGASAKEDPLQIKVADLAQTNTDPFLLQVRRILRQKYNFPAEGDFGILSVFSTEPVIQPADLHYDKGKGFKCVCPQGEQRLHSCEERSMIYGTASYVTGAFGLVLASRAVRFLYEKDLRAALAFPNARKN